MASTAYIADENGSNKVYFTYAPQKTFTKYDLISAVKPTLNSRDSFGRVIPGERHIYKGGTVGKHGVLNIGVLWMTESDYESILDKDRDYRMGRVTYSPDNGVTVYSGVLQSFSVEPIPGTVGFSGEIQILRTA